MKLIVTQNIEEYDMIGIGTGLSFKKHGISWSAYWTSLISATVENAAPTNVVLTFPVAQTSLIATDFTIAGFTISSASWAGAVLTLVLSTAVVYGDSLTVTFVKSGGTHAVTNNVLQLIINLTRNSDIVEAGGYLTIGTTSNLGCGAAGRAFLSVNNKIKCRQNGNIVKVKFYTDAITYMTAFYFQVWRKDGATYDLVGEENILNRIADNTTNTVTLTTPISVLEGDYFALAGIESQDEPVRSTIASIATATNNSFRYYSSGTRPTGNNFNWDGQSTITNLTIPIKVYMQAPLIVSIGDSIVAGHPLHYSYIEDSLTDVKLNSITAQLAVLDSKCVFQNMGISSQTTTQILARFYTDVVALKPKIVIINGGVNDIAGGVITKATFLTNYTAMLDMCVLNNIIPVVLKIAPWTNGTHAQLQTRDDWNTDLATLVASYNGKFVSMDSLGQFHIGGDAGNLWDIQAIYDSGDGVHMNLAGYTLMASLIYAKLQEVSTFIPDTSNEAESVDVFSRMIVAGETPVAARKILMNARIIALKAAGIWAKADGIYAVNNAVNGTNFNWITGLHDLANGVAPTFVSDRDLTGNGTTMYKKTGVSPKLVGFHYTQNSATVSIYSRTITAVTDIIVGAAGAASVGATSLYPRYTDNKTYFKINGGVELDVASTDGTGLFTLVRDSSTTVKFYKDKIKTDKTSTSDGLPPEIYILAMNSNGTAGGFSPRGFSLLFIGSALTPTEQGLWYDIMVDGYLAVIGAKV